MYQPIKAQTLLSTDQAVGMMAIEVDCGANYSKTEQNKTKTTGKQARRGKENKKHRPKRKEPKPDNEPTWGGTIETLTQQRGRGGGWKERRA